MSIKIEEIEEVLRKNKLDVAVIKRVVTELEEVEEDKKNDRVALPKQKNQFVIVVKGDLKKPELAGWVVQIPEGDDVAQTLPRLKRAAAATVNAQKRKRRPINTVGEAMEFSKRAFTKIEKVNVKTKEAVQVVFVPDDNLDKVV